jgi:hypothetical protein
MVIIQFFQFEQTSVERQTNLNSLFFHHLVQYAKYAANKCGAC